MQLQSSYIFIPKSDKINKNTTIIEKNNIQFDFEKDISDYIRNLFDISPIQKQIENPFVQTYNTILNINGVSADISFVIKNVAYNTYLDVRATGGSDSEIIKSMEHIQEKLNSVENDYIMIVSYDAISEYYCNQLYPLLNNLERNIRKLLYNIYIVNYGIEYYNKGISKEMRKRTAEKTRTSGSRNSRRKERVVKFFYQLTWQDLQDLLFNERLTDKEENEKKEFLSSNNNLSDFSDKELRIAFDKFTPKSDWSRFFNDKIDNKNIDNVESMFKQIQEYRNNIAHCKFISMTDYNKCYQAITVLNDEILSAIIITENKDFTQKNIENISKSLKTIEKRMSEWSQTLSKSIYQTLPNAITDFSDILKTSILNNKDE